MLCRFPYYTNTNEIPGELSRENLVSSHVKVTSNLEKLVLFNVSLIRVNSPLLRTKQSGLSQKHNSEKSFQPLHIYLFLKTWPPLIWGVSLPVSSLIQLPVLSRFPLLVYEGVGFSTFSDLR